MYVYHVLRLTLSHSTCTNNANTGFIDYQSSHGGPKEVGVLYVIKVFLLYFEVGKLVLHTTAPTIKYCMPDTYMQHMVRGMMRMYSI